MVTAATSLAHHIRTTSGARFMGAETIGGKR